jgi:hypothetical protein
MASTSTNKAPLLIDRPLLEIKRLDGTSTPAGSVDPASGTNAALLVDCTANDGALIEVVQLVQRVAGNTTSVNLYLSTNAGLLGADAFFLAQFNLSGGGDPGATAVFPLPSLLAPVPHSGGNDAATDAIPQFSGLRLAKGWALWAACNSSTPVATAPNILVQGGYF